MTRNLGAYIPGCVSYDPYQIVTASDVAYVLQHEIDMHEEEQDGALDADDIKEVRAALARIKRDYPVVS